MKRRKENEKKTYYCIASQIFYKYLYYGRSDCRNYYSILKSSTSRNIYSRLGNTILKELVKYDKKIKEQKKIVKYITENEEIGKDERMQLLKDESVKGNEFASWQLAWEYFEMRTSDGYMNASKYFKMCNSDKAKIYSSVCDYKQAVSLLDTKTVDGISLLKELDNKGNTYATVKLGMMYYKGEYVEKDYAEAKRYFAKASIEGNEIAQQILDNISKPYIDHTRRRKKYRAISFGRD